MTKAELWKSISFFARLTPSYTKIGYFWRRLSWGAPTRLDFSGQLWLVTGASAGIGKAIAQAAANANAQVIAVSNDQAGLDAARQELPGESAQRFTTVLADMSLQSGTQNLLDRLLDSNKDFDVLINNLGLMFTDMVLTQEGREITFVTNLLSHFLLTEGLLGADRFSDNAVIVNMSSGGMYNAPLGIRALNTTNSRFYNGKVSYAFAKRAQVALTGYWNEKFGHQGIRVYVTHPGWVKTPGVKKALPVFWKIQKNILRTPRQGGDTALWLCATRPPIGEEEVIWFDRKARATHMYEATRTPLCTVEQLVDYLRDELAQGT